MSELGNLLQSADFKSEKHAPVIECPDKVKADEYFEVKAGLGKEIAHPNTTEHFIEWIDLFFHPDGDKYAYEVGRFEFKGHGASVKGPNQGPVYCNPNVTASVKLTTSGTFHAMAQCNIHGLWESTKTIVVE